METIKFAIQPPFSANFSLSPSSTWSQDNLQAAMVIQYDHLTLALTTVWPEQRLSLGKFGIRSKSLAFVQVEIFNAGDMKMECVQPYFSTINPGQLKRYMESNKDRKNV